MVFGRAELWPPLFLVFLYTHIPSSLASAVCNNMYFQRGKKASFLTSGRHPYVKETTLYDGVQQMINSSYILLSSHKRISCSTSELSNLFF